MESPTKLLIRPVIPDEADVLTKIAISAKRHWNYPERWMQIWIPELTFSAEYFEANESWAAVLEGTPIAFYTWQDRNGIAWIENLWVLAEHIGMGVGKQLFLHALELARRRGHEIMQLESDPNARGFYEKMGMRKIGEHPAEVDGQPRMIPVMEIKL